MNTETAVFERVASGELTAEQAAKEMLAADLRAQEKRRPSWAPRWLWGGAQGVIVGVLGFLGLRRHD